ncbi:ABC transporter ATP-binding protein [Massilia horti]|uniref:sn-glycerol-3-phosphate ABC transporter ATP-binding protein UgpC n=1 Tax=Massilia horti TaxID=2562153 RepID=A0A4Y9T5J6_9BURK|nr:sn-glycerol-3-phosphate ABC transporter ATP-binding protein UgpC [Massilia horti]TFW33723.1 sn-glycerol-3-phosphate ABC transporter ATP-binding protein UgpC [Massilia horti]
MASLKLTGVRKSYGAHAILHGIDLDIEDGEFVVFVGPSGCGKSTLLRAICGLDEIDEGELFMDGVRINQLPPADRRLAMVFQNYALYPHMTVRENMGFALKLAGRPKTEIESAVLKAARALQIDALLDRRPKELSGGQRQRVAIGRAIVREPSIFLFDEPLSNLDAALRVQMRIELARLHRSLGTTMIYVTHDQVEAMTLADRIVVLNGGRIEQAGPPLKLYHEPDNLFVAGFLGAPTMNFLAGEVEAYAGDRAAVAVAGGATVLEVPLAEPVRPGTRVTVGVRPEHLDAGASAGIPATLFAIERLGDGCWLYANVKGSGEQMVVRADAERHWEPGQELLLSAPPQRTHVFGPDGRRLLP